MDAINLKFKCAINLKYYSEIEGIMVFPEKPHQNMKNRKAQTDRSYKGLYVRLFAHAVALGTNLSSYRLVLLVEPALKTFCIECQPW